MDKVISKKTGVYVSVGLLITIMGAVWLASDLASKVSRTQEDIKMVESELKEKPTRTEITLMQGDIKEIKVDIKSLLTK